MIKLVIASALLGLFPLSSFAGISPKCLPYGEKGLVKNSSNSVSEYTPELSSCKLSTGETLFVLRRFTLNNASATLAVEPKTLKSHIVSADCLSECKDIQESEYENSHYGDIHGHSVSAPFPLQNDGLTEGLSGKKQLALTIDMCPSKKGISKNVYDKLVAIAKSSGTAFPVGIAMTKTWMTTYSTHFSWLKEQAIDNRLNILWINHSDTHPYKANVALENNFLLSSGVDFTKEVLGTEKALVAGGVTPSLFFRFPGLVSSKKLILQLADWGIIPLGSKAWLAKGEKPKKDSVILIHGNQNEPAGEQAFLNFVEKKTSDLAWAQLLDLLPY